MASMRRTTRQSLFRLAIKRNSRAEISVRVMAIARPIYTSMLGAHTDSDFSGIENPKVSQLFGLVVSDLFPDPGLIVTVHPASHHAQEHPTLLSKDLVPATDRIIIEVQRLRNFGAGFAFI